MILFSREKINNKSCYRERVCGVDNPRINRWQSLPVYGNIFTNVGACTCGVLPSHK